MRTLKKALSLVLVLAMVFTLAVPALAVDKAADFKDYDKVTNKEAVDVLTAIGVINGNADGTFGAAAGDGATADCGFQSLSAAAERGEKMLYICYDNEGYMNTGYQRSSTTPLGSRTSTTPLGSKISGKEQQQKYVPLIMAMHQIEYCATASPSHMKDMVEKIQKGLEASKKGFAYLHIFSPCPTGWGYGSHLSITVDRRALENNI